MVNFLMLMTVPMGIAFATLYWYRHKIHIGEFGLQLAVPALVFVMGFGVSYCQRTTDVEVWNGRIAHKAQERVSCGHSYTCNCRTISTGKTTSTVCSTCYEHLFDYDWALYATTTPDNERITIDRIDRQGNNMPPRWGAAYLGEPFSSAHRYTNYILANPDSVLKGGKGDVKRFAALIPPYPSQVNDYYRTQHTLNVGNVPIDTAPWEWLLDEANGDLGPVKQVHVLVLFVNTSDPAYTLALKDAWVGGKKNDAVVVFGTLDGKKLEFVDVLSWTPQSIYKVELRDALYAIGSLDRRDDMVAAIRATTLSKFERMNMKDYQYLVRSFQPSSNAMIVLFLLGAFASIGLAVYAVNNEFDCDWERGIRRRYPRY